MNTMKKAVNTLKTRYYNMHSRCYDLKNKAFEHYGGKNISVEEEWHTMNNFIVWSLLHGFEESKTLERKNNSKSYGPKNCLYESRHAQALNRDVFKTNKSGYRNVHRSKITGRYIAQITVNGKKTYISTHNTPLEAAIAVNKYIIANNLPNRLSDIL